MATRQAHAPAESGEASTTYKTVPTTSGKPGEIFLHGIVFIPSGGNVGALPTGLSGDGGEGFGVSSDPSPVNNVPPPPSPTPQPQDPQPQPEGPPPQGPQPTKSPSEHTHEQPFPTPTAPSENKPSNDRSPVPNPGGMTFSADTGGGATNNPLPTNVAGLFPLSASSSRTAVPVAACDGTDACVTISGKTYSFVATGVPSTSSYSIDAASDGSGPSLSVLYPSSAPMGLDVIQHNPFHRQTLTIISICTFGYFLVAIASLVGVWIVARHRGRKRSIEYV